MIQTGLFAGFLTALAYSLVQALTVTPLLLRAETYEQAAGATGGAAAQQLPANGQIQPHQRAAEPAAWAPSDGVERYVFTFFANVISAVGFAFLLVAGFAVSRRPVDLRRGLAWGLAGYASFVLAPSLGLPPEVPGNPAADLDARQLWWVGTVAATAGGLALLVFVRPLWLRLAGIPILAVPHLIGAPPPVGVETGPVPAELASQYVVWVLVSALFFWLLLGGSAGAIYRRLGGEARAAARSAAR